jgi:hypothetical protein
MSFLWKVSGIHGRGTVTDIEPVGADARYGRRDVYNFDPA